MITLIYFLHGNIVNFSHMSPIHSCFIIHPKRIQTKTLARCGPHVIHPPLADHTHHLKWHPYPISCFSTAYPLDRLRDSPTDDRGDKPVRKPVHTPLY